ncbi:transporter substrate-binding domain-containing protein [Rhodoferax sp. AJA081-3]|uniref:substrate-binding periplasmic protein n=1 Tax=Rhodoferax sp. AJA081-3 TaxID=2752316 RepID=UPI001ADEDC0A|nr:transporter substrate-binding domain-containing protein [Rhodoferax sp. AJA081-3]QTN26144.1 transporter substrate-binding domain-containing protein [Rhodoferax sp. AJA081-3]
MGAPLAFAQGRTVRKAPLLVGTRYPTPGSYTGTALALVYREAFTRLGQEIQLVVLPGRRAEEMLTTGELDAELHRAKEYGDNRPTLRRVASPHFTDNFVAYATKPLVLQKGWDGLKNVPLNVDYVLGSAKTEKELKLRVPAAQLHAVRSIESGLQKLLAGNSDVFVQVESAVDSLLLKPEFKATPIRKVSVLEMADGYAYFSAKNQALAAPLAKVLDAMRKDGTTESLLKQAALEESV